MTRKEIVTVDAYPITQINALPRNYRYVKTIHFLRHAQGTHNVNQKYRDLCNIDARLTPEGIEQCEALHKREHSHTTYDLIVTSTLTRCVQTVEQCFPNPCSGVPRLAHEMIRETVNYACDRRRRISEISAEFPGINFSNVMEDEDEIWNKYDASLGINWNHARESAELYQVAQRGRVFLNWLCQRGEQNVVVCTHSAFLRCILSWGHNGGVYHQMNQTLDDRVEPGPDKPLFNYCGDIDFERQMRADYENCEMRSFVIAFD